MSKLFDFPPFGRKVLIVDDQAMILKLLSTVVSSHNFEPLVAGSAEEARPLIENNRLAGMLIDKNLPGIDGIELMRGVRTIQPHCACIIITGYPSRDSAMESIHLGASDYIPKPFEDVMLVANSLERAVARSRLEYESEQIKARLAQIIATGEGEALAEDVPLAEALNRGVERLVTALLAELDHDLPPGEAMKLLLACCEKNGDGSAGSAGTP